ncbi:MAG: class I SAM-dependent methyltransferase [Gammaproteobacteria bacterium]|nr:class I SAM-dependent methyltransferase [Gammaproteobacteria bacterium]
MSVFENYAKYYDLLYQDKDYTGEANFIVDIIKSHSPNAASILDLGCGTGYHAALIAKEGYSVHGVDRSESILVRADERKLGLAQPVAQKLSFSKGDVCSVRIQEKFDVVVSLFHVMSYQITNEDIQAAFTTAAAHLKDGGIFIFDCWYGPGVLTERPEPRIKKVENEYVKIIRVAEPVMHPNKNLVDVNYTVLVTEKDSDKFEQINEKHQMRYWFMPEIEFFLAKSGFELVKSGQWMTNKDSGFDCWSVYFVGKK